MTSRGDRARPCSSSASGSSTANSSPDEPGGEGVSGDGVGEPPGDGDEQLVAGGVAEAVVHDLEPVEVAEEHGRARAVGVAPSATATASRSVK